MQTDKCHRQQFTWWYCIICIITYCAGRMRYLKVTMKIWDADTSLLESWQVMNCGSSVGIWNHGRYHVVDAQGIPQHIACFIFRDRDGWSSCHASLRSVASIKTCMRPYKTTEKNFLTRRIVLLHNSIPIHKSEKIQVIVWDCGIHEFSPPPSMDLPHIIISVSGYWRNFCRKMDFHWLWTERHCICWVSSSSFDLYSVMVGTSVLHWDVTILKIKCLFLKGSDRTRVDVLLTFFSFLHNDLCPFYEMFFVRCCFMLS